MDDGRVDFSALRRRFGSGRAMAMAGMAGLFFAGFLAQEETRRWFAPFGGLLARNVGVFLTDEWLMLVPFLCAPVLLVIRIAALETRRPRAQEWIGWIACLFFSCVFIAAAIRQWSGVAWASYANRWWHLRELTDIADLLSMPVVALALIGIVALPARMRVAACVAVVGAWCSFQFLLTLSYFVHYSAVSICFGFWLALASSLLMAVGGFRDLRDAWRANEPARA